MNTLEAIFTRRSIRSFIPEPIPNETLKVIIEAAAAAPSGGNIQNWIFIAVQDPLHIRALRALSPGIIGNPAAIVAMCTDKNRMNSTKEGNVKEMALIDLGAALQNMLLAAHDLGFGGCPVGSFHEQAIKTYLNIPDHLDIRLLVVLGRPKHFPKPPPKRSLEEIFFIEKFDIRKNG